MPAKRGLSRDPLADSSDPFGDIGTEVTTAASHRSSSRPTSQRFVRQVIYLDPEDAQWLKELQAGALVDGQRLPAGLVLRTALRQLRDRGRDWPALRVLLQHQADLEPGVGRPPQSRASR